MNTVRVLISSNFVLLRTGLRSLLSRTENVECVGESGVGSETIEHARQVRPDVLVLDIVPEEACMLTLIGEIKKQLPQTEIVALSETEDRETALRLLRAGVKGYLSRRESLTELTSAVEMVARGEVFLCPSASQALITEYREKGRAGAVSDPK